MHRAVEIPGLGEVTGGAEQPCGVTVMAAGLHAAVVARPIREIGGFLDRQCVHIGSEPDRARRIADPQPADDASAANAAKHLAAKFRELVRNELGGALLLEPELGMRVKVAPPI